MTHDVFLTNPDGPTAQELTIQSIHKQVNAMKIEQDCALIDLARAARAYAYHSRLGQRHRQIIQRSAANDDAWREAMQTAAGNRKLAAKERQRNITAAESARSLGVREGKITSTYLDAIQTGKDDADSMTEIEVIHAIHDYQT